MTTTTQSFVGTFAALVAFGLLCFLGLVIANTHARNADRDRYMAQCKASNALMTDELCLYYWNQQAVRK